MMKMCCGRRDFCRQELLISLIREKEDIYSYGGNFKLQKRGLILNFLPARKVLARCKKGA